MQWKRIGRGKLISFFFLQDAEREHQAEVEKFEKEKQDVETRLEEMKSEEESLQAKVRTTFYTVAILPVISLNCSMFLY